MTETNLCASVRPSQPCPPALAPRRGLLENDIILTRFLDAHETELTDEEVDAFTRLGLSDNALMDLVLARKEPEGESICRTCTRCCSACA
jgi:antitoxin CptB